MKIGLNGRTVFTTTSHHEKNCSVPISYVIRKDTPSLDDGENRDVHIIYQESLFGKMFTRDSRKVIDILKGLTLGTDAETWIKGLRCGRKVMQ